MDSAVSDMKIHSSQSGTPDDFGKVFDACDISTLGLGEKTAMSLKLAQATQRVPEQTCPQSEITK